MKIVVFLGPSLTVTKAREILPEAVYLPPAAQMDLMSAVRLHRPTIIALIDGVFERVPSVWHKEILYALESGVHVYGASSMGALRVAETAAFGAVGVGEIFRLYAEGELLDDDEVALSHAGEEFSFRPLTEPMVNLRATFRQALQDGHLDQQRHDLLIKVAKSQHFTRRTLGSILEDSGLEPQECQRVERLLRQNYVDQKGLDARELLTLLRDHPPTEPPKIDFTLQQSAYFTRQERRERLVSRPPGEVALERIAGYYALHSDDFEEVNFAALNLGLVQILAELLQLRLEPEDLQTEELRFRLWLRLKKTDLPAWLEQNDLSPQEFEEMIRQRATCRVLHRNMNREGYRGNKATTALLNELRARGVYPQWADRAARQEATVRREVPEFPTAEHDIDDMRPLVIEHLKATPCRMTTHFPEWGKEAGFLYDDALKIELLKAKLLRDSDWECALSLFEGKP